jgi:hypothetical protein
MPSLPPTAIDTYEALRTEVLAGRSRPEGLAAVVYHGMWHGLRVLPTTVECPPPAVPPRPALDHGLPPERPLVHLLANMLLRTQSEVLHVY